MTFDGLGISGHLNHIAVSVAVRYVRAVILVWLGVSNILCTYKNALFFVMLVPMYVWFDLQYCATGKSLVMVAV